jgi:importin-7
MAVGPRRLHSYLNWCFPPLFRSQSISANTNSFIDEYENYSSPVAAATTFLCQLVSSRTKVTFLPVLGLVDRVLDTHPASPQRFGALNMLSALAPFAMRHPDVKHKMEDFTMKYVFPEFSSSEGYMRAVV